MFLAGARMGEAYFCDVLRREIFLSTTLDLRQSGGIGKGEMIVRKGGRLGNGVAGKGFFEMFYRWSRLGCSGQRCEYWTTFN